MARSIGSLARWSIISVLCLPVILLTILIRAPAYAPEEPIPFEWIGSDVFGALGIMAFAFTCHQVAFNNFLTLEDQTTSSWKHTTILSTGISWAISLSFAAIGYMCFGKGVQSNLFMNFDIDDPIINIGRFALSISMILTIPMGIFPTREAVQKSLGFETATKQPTNAQHYGVTLLVFGIVLSMGIAVRSLGTVYALVGGFSATTLANIIPACAYIFTRNAGYPDKNSDSETSSETAINKLSNVMAFPTLTTTSTLTPDENDLKAPLLWETSSIASSSRNLYFDDDVATVDGGDDLCGENDMLMNRSLKPHWFLDIAAGLLLIWGFSVMFFSISATLRG